jgi:O-antigen/teichoic acid export membrane protein
MYSPLANFLQKTFRFDAHYFLRGGFWLISSQFILIIFGLATSVFFANYLEETEFGKYRYLISISIILSSFSLSGLGQSILQTAIKKYYYFYTESVRLSLIYNLGISFSGIIGAIYYFINENITLAIGCLLIAILQPVITTFSFVPGFLQGQKKFRESTFTQVLKSLLVAISSLVGLYFTHNILILFFIYLSSQALTGFISHFLYRPAKNTGELYTQEIKNQYISYAKHTSIRNIISTIAFRLDSVLLFTSLGALELAVYTIATQIPEQIKGSFKNLSSLLFPKYSNHSDIKTIKISIAKKSLQLFIILVAISIIYSMIAPFLYKLLFPKYLDAIFYSQLFSIAFPAYIYYLPLTALMSQLDDKKLYAFHIKTSIFQIFVTIAFVYTSGLLGAIIANLISQYTKMIYCYWLIFKN